MLQIPVTYGQNSAKFVLLRPFYSELLQNGRSYDNCVCYKHRMAVVTEIFFYTQV